MVISTPGFCRSCHEHVEERNCEGICVRCSLGDLEFYDIPLSNVAKEERKKDPKKDGDKQ